MQNDYLPAKETNLAAWLLNFDTKITATPAAYGLTAAQATAFSTLRVSYANALAVTQVPATRTTVSVADKAAKKAAAVGNARDLVRIVQNDPDTTDAQRAELAINIPDSSPTQVQSLLTKPVASVVLIANLSQTIRLHDELTPTSNARPFGSIGAEVWTSVGSTPPASVDQCKYQGLATRNTYAVPFDPDDAGKTAYHITRWITRRGTRGPTSDVVSATVAA
jgi:hypothetical protein